MTAARRALEALSLVPIAGVTSLTLLAACASGSKVNPTTVGGAKAGADGGAALPFAPLPSDLPPMATMPPPGVAGSKRVSTKEAPPCSAAVAIEGKSATADLGRVLQTCAKGKAPIAGSPTATVKQGATDPHQEHSLTVPAGKCIRVYITHTGQELVAVLRDRDGAIAAESAETALPSRGPVCATKDETLVLAVGAGSGQATYSFVAVEE